MIKGDSFKREKRQTERNRDRNKEAETETESINNRKRENHRKSWGEGGKRGGGRERERTS